MNSPKEEALKLVDSFIQASVVYDEDKQWYHPKPYTMAVQCALIAVDEILKNNSTYAVVKFYQEVKKELEAMK